MGGEAILTATTILNRIPRKNSDVTPYELWKGHKPSYKHLKVWGCLAKVEIPKPKQVKIGPKTVDCIFIGYANNSSAYRFLVHKSPITDIHEGTVIESRNAHFFEEVFPRKENKEIVSRKRDYETAIGSNVGVPEPTGSEAEFEGPLPENTANPSSTSPENIAEPEALIPENSMEPESSHQENVEEPDVEPRKSKRARTAKDFGPEFLTYMVENEPKTIQEALSNPDAALWKEAI